MDGVPTPEQSAAWRLADVEARLEELTQRIGGLEASLRGAVAEEVQGATGELRRAITELGRRLVQDLPHELARHRDKIVADLRPPPPPEPAPVDEAPAPEPEPEAELTDDDAPEDDEDTPETPERRRGHRLRRRPG